MKLDSLSSFPTLAHSAKTEAWTPLASVSYKRKNPKKPQKNSNKQKNKTEPRSDKTWHSQRI